MPTNDPFLERLLAVGIDPTRLPLSKRRRLGELRGLCDTDVAQLLIEAFRAEDRAELATHNCREAAKAAEGLEKLLKGLLSEPPDLWSLEFVELNPTPGASPLAYCRRGNIRRALSIHPEVDLAQLAALKPWHLVKVHPKEPVVIGLCTHESLYAASLGEVVVLKRYVDKDLGLVEVERPGGAESIAQLSQELRATEWPADTRLTLLRDEPAIAVRAVAGEETDHTFDYPIESVQQSLDDLGGMESLKRLLAEQVVTNLIELGTSKAFDLDPLGGMILSSRKPGMGKSTFVLAAARWLAELGRDNRHPFDVHLMVVKPNGLKSVWHGGDAKAVRALGASVRAKIDRPRSRPLMVIVCFEEIDSLSRRVGGNDGALAGSSAANDAVQALLTEMDHIKQAAGANREQPCWVLFVGTTNRPDMIDIALKRPERFGDKPYEMPDLTAEGAEAVCEVYCRRAELPWDLDGDVRSNVPIDEIRQRLICPAVAAIFGRPVLRYLDDHRRGTDVTAGEMLAAVHYRDAIKRAKRRAAMRHVMESGVPAVGYEDLVEGLWETTLEQARQLQADRYSLVQQLGLRVPVVDVELLGEHEPLPHRYLREAAD